MWIAMLIAWLPVTMDDGTPLSLWLVLLGLLFAALYPRPRQ